MINCCANPACQAECRSLGSGDLYALERRSANTEFFWICSSCATIYGLCLGETGKMSLQSRLEVRPPRPPRSEICLRLIFSRKEQRSTLQTGPVSAGHSSSDTLSESQAA